MRLLHLGITAETLSVNSFQGRLDTSNLMTHESLELFVPAGDREEIRRQHAAKLTSSGRKLT
jgi:hypothetical protein